MSRAQDGGSKTARDWLGIIRLFWPPSNPFVLRSLRESIRARSFLILFSTLPVMVIFSILSINGFPPALMGRNIFDALYGWELVIVCLIAPSFTAHSVISDRRNGVFEQLIATGISPFRVVWGKFLANFTLNALLLLTILPLMMIVLPYGFTPVSEVLRGTITMFVLLVFSVAAGVTIGIRIGSARSALLLSISVMPILFFLAMLLFQFANYSIRELFFELSSGSRFLIDFFLFGPRLARRSVEFVFGLTGWAQFVVPLWLIGTSVWFLFLLSQRGIDPVGGERLNRAFRAWTLGSLMATTCVAPFLVSKCVDFREAQFVCFFLALCAGGGAFFSIFLHMGEPAKRPHARSLRSSLRFTFLVAGAIVVFVPTSSALGVWWQFSEFSLERVVDPLLAISSGNLGVVIFSVALALWFRVLQKNTQIARMATFVIILALVVFPVTIVGALESHVLHRLGPEIPWILRISPAFPSMFAWSMIVQRELHPVEEVLPTSFGYGCIGFILFVLLDSYLYRQGTKQTSQTK